MRLQLPKNADPKNPHKYWVFGPRYSYTVAAEQKARVTYDNLLRLIDDPDIIEPLKFLRARELVHYQRFGEVLRNATDKLDCKNFYAFNPSFDKDCLKK
ncbi:MAG: hypothetical protein E7561_06160 [Ruminococcaceae bacterium]|nr:hypothetical protein [Oscillospiraceae bacterium]